MIDRITIYIKDVDFTLVEKRLGLTPSGIAKDSSFNYSAKIKNLKVNYRGRTLWIEGSLHKYAKKNNYSLFTYDEARNVLYELSDIIGIDLQYFIVTKIELGLNMCMVYEPKKYIDIIHSYRHNRFYYMTPMAGTSKIRGCRCKLSEYEIKFYDKTFEVIHSDKVKVVDRDTIPINILRYELAMSRKQLKSIGLKNVTGKNLLSPLHYTRFKRVMTQIYNKIVFNDDTISYAGMLEDDVKRYIFATSENYDRYLEYLKEYVSEEAYKKERRRTNILLKRVDSLKTGKLKTELKTKFQLAISLI